MPALNSGFKLRAANGDEFAVTGPFRIGRDDECQIKVPNTLASRIHASIWVDHGQLLLRDEGSRNGTYVNGRRIEPGVAHRLYDSDRIQIVGDTYVVVTPPPPFEPPKTSPPSPGFAAQKAPPTPAAPAEGAGRGSRMILRGSVSAIPRPALYSACGCALLIVLCLCVASGFFVTSRGQPVLATLLGPRGSVVGPVSTAPFTVQVLATTTPAPPLSPADYAATSQDLAGALAELNQAQLQLIRDLSAQPPASSDALDAGLRQVAALAFKVGTAASDLARASAVQAGGSDTAGQISALYTGLASYGFAQALDGQNLRADLASGTLDPVRAAALLADYGARAWNPSVTNGDAPGNPFTALSSDPGAIPAAPPLTDPAAAGLAASLGPQAGLQSWAAAAPDTLTRTASLIPATRPLADPFDPALIASLSSADGQLDGDTASQAALQALLRLGATESVVAQGLGADRGVAALSVAGAAQGAHAVSYQAPAAVLITADQEPGGGNLPAFPGGTANGLTQNENDFVNNVMAIDDANTPGQPERVPVQAANPIVTLTLSNITVKSIERPTNSTFEARVILEYDVAWIANLESPRVPINCSSNQTTMATTARGSAHMQATALLILYPGNADVFCYAGQSDRQLGFASATVLVGDAAGATQRAIQVETDSAVLDLTLTADESGRLTATFAAATQTQAVARTQAVLETEQAATQTAAVIQTATQSAAQTATAQGASIFTLRGTYGLTQGDRGCTFADAPYTSGIVTLNVDFTTGAASMSLSGGGGGVRTGLRCNDSTGNMSWQQDYSADLNGTVDANNGALTLAGKLNGQNNVSWHDCRLNGEPEDCPAGYSNPYTFDVQLTGTVDRTAHTARGTWFVLPIDLPTSGDWSAGE